MPRPPPNTSNPSSLTVHDIWYNGKATASQVAQHYLSGGHQPADRAPTTSNAKTYIVTGATSGLGRQVALVLGRASIRYRRPMNLILAVRNLDQGNEVVQEILQTQATNSEATTNTEPSAAAVYCNIHVWPLDLSRLASVRQFVEKFKEWSNSSGSDSTSIPLDGLINNAGVHGIQELSEDGFLVTWQVNALAPFLLTRLLEPYLSNDARVVNVSSVMHSQVGTFDGPPAILGGLNLMASCQESNIDIASKCPPKLNRSTNYDYALSKACQVLHAHALTLQFAQERRHGQQELLPEGHSRRFAFAVDPGMINTNLSRHQNCSEYFFDHYIFKVLYGRSVDQGCSSIVFCLLAPWQDLQPPPPPRHGKKNANPISKPNRETPDFYYFNCAPAEPVGYCQDAERATALAKLFDDLLSKSSSTADATTS